MATYTPKIVDSTFELKCARKLGETVIVSTGIDFFTALDKKATGNKVAKTTKKFGKAGLVVGGVLTVLSGGIFGLIPGLVILGASTLGTVAGVAMDQFKDYKIIMDYNCKRVIFLKTKGSRSFDENKDTIAGIDLNAIIQKK